MISHPVQAGSLASEVEQKFKFMFLLSIRGSFLAEMVPSYAQTGSRMQILTVSSRNGLQVGPVSVI